jgi:sugar phosphate isomerase/epimerase
MKLSQVAVQLFTLRDHCKTAADLAATARKLRTLGYTAVQVSSVGPIPEEEIVAIMRGEGLTICATHEPGNVILDETDRVIERLQKLGCRLTAYPWPQGVDFTDPVQTRTLARKLDLAGAKLRAAGLVLGYHNHAIEFVRCEGRLALELIYELTDPKNVVGELDTYWIHYGGGDVLEWCRKLRGRLPFIHLKDYCFLPTNTHNFCEVGAGTLPFAKIIAEAEAGGCEWFIVEQDTCPGDPFDSLAQSLAYIRQNLVTG